MPTPPLRTAALERAWPSTQSLDLVRAPLARVADAMATELARFFGPENLATEWRRFATLDDAFASADDFTNVPTMFLALPTRTPWTVLWSNGFLCDGYDSLCFCLTRHHGLRTIHVTAHDEVTTFQPGASFTHRRLEQDRMIERSVYVGRQDARWDFVARGEPLPEEDLGAYQPVDFALPRIDTPRGDG